MKQTFTKRIESFARCRHRLINLFHVLRLTRIACLAAVLAMLLLAGWIGNPFVNLLIALVFLVVLVYLAGCLVRNWSRFRCHMTEAFQMEDLAGSLDSRLVSALDFLKEDSPSILKQSVINDAVKDLELSFEQKLDRTPYQQQLKRFVISIVLLLVVMFLPYVGITNAWQTLMRSWQLAMDTLFPVEYVLEPDAGQHVYQLGKTVPVSLTFKSRPFEKVRAVITRKGKEEIRELATDAGKKVSLSLSADVETIYQVHFVFGRRQTKTIKLVFTKRPVLENMEAEMIYPSYTRILPRTLEGIQDRLLGLPGTRLSLGLTFSKEIVSATITWDDGEELPMDVAGRYATTRLIMNSARTASIQVKDNYGFNLEFPVVINFDLMKDEKPTISVPKFLKSDMPYDKNSVGNFTFGARLSDDYGVSRCVLTWEKASVNNPTAITKKGEIERLISPVRRNAKAAFENVFNPLKLQPGDKVFFKVTVFDNCSPNVQSASSTKYSLFVFDKGLEDEKWGNLKFGSASFKSSRIPKTKKQYSVKSPTGDRLFSKETNAYDAKIVTDVSAPTIKGPDKKAIVDYFKLLATEVEKNDEK